MNEIKEDIELVKTEIRQYFQDPLDGALETFLLTKSKYIRTRLALLYFKAQDYNINLNIIKILAIGEIIHNASLLHDDVIDDSEKRRGVDTVRKTFGNNISILSGDYLVSYAIEKILELNNVEILKVFKDCVQSMSQAEITQYKLRGQIPNKDVYFDICKGKTGSLFSAILRSIALILSADTKAPELFGMLFGLYFQIKNDLETSSAKNDIKNQIFTVKSISGIENTDILLDNLRGDMLLQIKDFPVKIYREYLEDLINNYDR